jgi:predicted AAA+ superfamily ATPase
MQGRKVRVAIAFDPGRSSAQTVLDVPLRQMIIAHAVVDSAYPRSIEPALIDRLGRSPVVVVTGARQTGKTTLVRSFAGAALRGYETLDRLVTLDRARHEPEALLESKKPLTIDEVQRAPELLLAVKNAVDNDRRPGRFLLTGSANLLLLRGIGDSLAGRVLYLVMRPMTEREKRRDNAAPAWSNLMSAGGIEDALDSVAPRRRLDWRDASLSGGFPPAALAKDPIDRGLWLDGYVDTYVQRDLRDLAQVGDLASFVRFMRLVALRTGGLVNHADLARDAAVGRTTAQRWLSILETSFLVTVLPAFAATQGKRLIKAPKLYAGDTGLALRLVGVDDRDDLNRAPSSGVWLENLVLNDLLAWKELETKKPSVFHFRSAGGEEIDFVVERGRRVLPIEVKARNAVRVEDAKAIDRFCAEIGHARSPFGIVLYDGQETLRLTRTTIAVPISAVL